MKKNAAAISAIESHIESLQGEIFGNEAGIKKLQEQIDTYQKQIDNMRLEIVGCQEAIKLLSD